MCATTSEPSDGASKNAPVMEPRDAKYKDSIITVPNLICFGRIIGSVVLLGVAFAGLRYWFVGLFIALSLSDWVDGRLARWLKQRSVFGARLDSFADSVLYAALVAGALILSWNMVRPELIWIAVAVASYALTVGVGLWKFGRIPSYHTFAAKKSNWLALLAGVALVLEWSVWPLRICAIATTLTNLEATAISLVLDEWRSDVSTLFRVWPNKTK